MQMRQISLFKIFIILVLLLAGCSRKIKTISNGEWLKIISERSNINSYTEVNPYYLNIDKGNEYFGIIQALHEFGVISNEYQLNLDEPLKKDFVAYTLMNLYGETLNGAIVKDSNKSIYSKHINKIVSIGLMNLDNRELFHPQYLISKEDANNLLDKVLLFIDNKYFEDSLLDFSVNEDNVIEVAPEFFDKEKDLAYFPSNSNLKKDDIFHFKDNNQDVFKKVEDIQVVDDKLEANLSNPNLEEVFDRIDAYNTFEVDFNRAIIEDLSSSYNYENIKDITTVSNINTKEFKFEDFNVKYSVSSGNINVSINKKLNNGAVAYAGASLFNVKPTYKWVMDGGNIKEGYFKLDFKTNESFGLKKEHYKKYYGDFSKINPNNFLGSIQNIILQDKVLGTIPICKITVPIPNIPTMSIVFELQVNLYASGKIELSIANEHTMGMEIRNNNLRLISNHTNKADFIIQASGNVMLNLQSGLNLANLKLADIGLSSGVKAILKSRVFLYDKDGSVKEESSELPYDLISELSENNNDIKTCGDLNVYWALDLNLNTDESMAGKLGLSKKFHIFDEKNGSLLTGLSKHIQNMKFVDKCNVESREKNDKNIDPADSNKIRLKNYSIILDAGEQRKIEFLNLPDGYEINDIIFEVNNNDVCKVDSSGNVIGIKKGNGIVLIKSGDGKHIVKCHIFVRE